ncbi:5-methyltetrahydropteroyltriglutamate--homocysteine S-methyltransferase (plasmid) [Nicoliella spurrieriana]|uniref:5-methyltetrahydropteroyltriglutamate--homocysteine methyltransferase n=1 Tax=Nicoliella spurrieriana TaxID=2925830 RepID=A0A976RR44_9LACO|nr:5-methyltetrahydropteroyltriglutamate--homocysteine S-methyltransferase [Nicoliella spurrieriana]UQS86215.1 5-methyltetrahydropteroyltriglutamate--homocysteine S-methyltransferase [Nicoliella spurrieriana]
MTKTIIGFPRIGEHRELKFATEHYWKHQIDQSELLANAHDIKVAHWQAQKDAGIDLIPVGDFSFFDNLLDTAVALNVVSKRYRDLNVSELDEYFAQARGYQADGETVRALPMKKWFNTNYHYIVPEFTNETDVKLIGHKLFDEIKEAQNAGVDPKAVIVGPYTLLKLSRFLDGTKPAKFVQPLIAAYQELLAKLNQAGVEYLQIDEPALSFDVDGNEKAIFDQLYDAILANDHGVKVILQSYFGDIRDVYEDVTNKPFYGIGLDFLEGAHNLELINEKGFPADKHLFAGVVNGKNIWRNEYDHTLNLLAKIKTDAPIVLSTSCSLLHVPYSAANEDGLASDVKQHLAFAIEKLGELVDLDHIVNHDDAGADLLAKNEALFKNVKHPVNSTVHNRINALTDADYTRLPERSEREKVQKDEFKLPTLPTTTIGSFPQTADVRANRRKFRHHEITRDQYDEFNREKIARIIKIQEDLGLDVLVHGEYERNDMVEYFGEKLDGFVFTQNGWVQSYGTRGVKPPIIWGDISRTAPITVDASVYANNLTDKWVKGMLTGPVTIFNWSFPREDIARKETVTQISLALRDEVLDLEKNDIKIIQIDEPALRENLPLRKSDWYKEYLDWAVPAFRLVHSGVQESTQIHTHMCYSEFGDILKAIDNLDADVISFEASRADFTLIDELVDDHFQTEVGPGVYDIHSPRIPSEAEIQDLIQQIISKLPVDKIWINPDCGLKTRSEQESFDSLKNMVEATKVVRGSIYEHS